MAADADLASATTQRLLPLSQCSIPSDRTHSKVVGSRGRFRTRPEGCLVRSKQAGARHGTADSRSIGVDASGDLRADRRYRYAEAVAAEGDHEAAADLLVQAIEIAPRWTPAWMALAKAKTALGQKDLALSALEHAMALSPEDPYGVQLHLALLTRDSPSAMSRAYIQRLFDQYAAHFDAHLCGPLFYRGPAILRNLYDTVGARRVSHAIDLGCGTGLVARTFTEVCGTIDGVDLSPEMIKRARHSELYRRLEVADMLEFMGAEPAACADLVLASDVLTYVGDLAPIFSAVSILLRGGGRFVFTVQAQSKGTFILAKELRFSHSLDYILATVNAAHMSPIRVETAALRKERGTEVSCLALVVEKHG
jgi:predicted TPR repeat methyltransferase